MYGILKMDRHTMKHMKQIPGGVTAAKGFEAAGVEAGIKYKNRMDMALVYSQTPCKVAGTFTTNVVKAAPVKWDQKVVHESEYAQAVIINAGVANACTGEEGYGYCLDTAKAAARVFGIPEESVLVASTGVIGMQLPMNKILAGVDLLAEAKGDSLEHGTLASKAIMTTDTVNKEIAVEVEISGKIVKIGGMCKGSGMIHPNMCTMLGFVTTDVNISKELLLKALQEDVKDTYNMVSVDGDTSTNDTVLLLANGMAGNAEITEENEDYKVFCEALNFVNTFLARKIAGYTGRFNLYIVPFTEQQLAIRDNCPEDHLTLIMRRMMMMTAERIALKNNSLALITGESLGLIKRIDLNGLDERLEHTKIIAACDVNNPLTGPNGATYVYGPQKGATDKRLPILEAGMENVRSIIREMTEIDLNEVPGAGAAGGIGAGEHKENHTGKDHSHRNEAEHEDHTSCTLKIIKVGLRLVHIEIGRRVMP